MKGTISVENGLNVEPSTAISQRAARRRSIQRAEGAPAGAERGIGAPASDGARGLADDVPREMK